MAEKSMKKTTAPKTSSKKKTLKTAKSRAASSSSATRVSNEPTPTAPSQPLRVKRSYIVTFLGILLLVGLIYIFRSLIVAATVNGQPISRLSIISELERQGGKQALDSIITKTLIVQEAKNRNTAVSQSEVDAELKKIDDNLAKQGQKLDQVLQLQGMTKEQLVEQIKLQKMIEKMVGKVEVTDKEVDDYLTANQESLPEETDQTAQRANIKTQLQQQKLNEKAQKFLEELRAKAKVTRFVSY